MAAAEHSRQLLSLPVRAAAAVAAQAEVPGQRQDNGGGHPVLWNGDCTQTYGERRDATKRQATA